MSSCDFKNLAHIVRRELIDKCLDYDYSNVNCDDEKNSSRYGEVLNLDI